MQYISCDLPSDFPTTATHATDPIAHYATDPAAYATDPAAGMFNPLLTGFSEWARMQLLTIENWNLMAHYLCMDVHTFVYRKEKQDGLKSARIWRVARHFYSNLLPLWK